MRRRRAVRPSTRADLPTRILIISASMGAGHDGAARNLAEQLRADGHVVEVRDFLRSGPLRIGSALRSGYEFELRHVPSAYDATYRLWYRVPWLCPVVAWLVTALTRRRVLRWIAELEASVVVSTYPLSTLCLGRLRRTGRLGIPAVNFITDFGVHPLWVDPGMDLNLAIHARPAQVAAERTGRPAEATGPAVSARFDPDRLPPRDEIRRRFGIGPDDRAVLIVAGSWGVGNVAATFDSIAGDGRFLAVVVCGRDDRLRALIEARAERRGVRALVLGWTDEMPSLMSACDALVENAGGLTSLEAMRVGLPVVSFDPIAGHGRENTAAMDQVGVGRLAPDAESLLAALAELTSPGPGRAAQAARASAMFRRDPAEAVLAATVTAPPEAAHRTARRAVRMTATAAATAGLVWGGLTTGVAMATEAGAGVVHAGPGAAAVAYVGVRLDVYELASASVVGQLRRMNATAVLDSTTAAADPTGLRRLVGDGVSVANGGLGQLPGADADGESTAPWARASVDARAGRQLSALIQAPVTLTVPGRRLTAWDLMECARDHLSLVVPDHVIHASQPAHAPMRLVAGDIYLVNGMGASPAQLADLLARMAASLSAHQLAAAPLTTLA